MKKKGDSKPKGMFNTGKRRLAVARAKIEAGTGVVKINSKPLDIWGTEVLRLWVREPLMLAGELASKVNIYVSARSGGIVGQAEAVRMAIAKSLVEFSKDPKLRKAFVSYDRNMMVYDPRRNEPHHAGGASKRGSRRHKQRSKR